ncbi:MAG: GTP-binding protein [Thermoguttaceae bacterium]
MPLPRLILVGGFLGAGKTTLLAQAAVRLAKHGHRVGLVANDQAAGLVDSEVLKITGACVEEVAGGCFCCRFPDMSALERLAQREGADVLLGEPVGSCTDLAATVMQPLKQLHGAQFGLAPLSVLVDGNQLRVLARLRAAAEQTPGSFPDNVLYIYEKQLEEADLIVLNKADRLVAGELSELTASLAARFPGKPLLAMSALAGGGVDAWLEFVAEHGPVGQNVVDVDYDIYAAGEAALGWLNAVVALRARGATDCQAFAEDLLEEIRRGAAARGAEIAHVKLIIGRGPEEGLIGSLTSNYGQVFWGGHLDSVASEATMRINARVHIRPNELQAIVEEALRVAAGERFDVSTTALSSFSPGRPVPTHRFAAR